MAVLLLWCFLVHGHTPTGRRKVLGVDVYLFSSFIFFNHGVERTIRNNARLFITYFLSLGQHV